MISFHHDFRLKFCMYFFLQCVLRSFHHVLLDLIILIILGEVYKITTLPIDIIIAAARFRLF
jgi:hypothetical protein